MANQEQLTEAEKDLHKLRLLSYATREAQKRYFRFRTPDALEKAKKLEKQLDDFLLELAEKDKPKQMTILG